VEAPRLPEVDTEFARSMGVKDGDVDKFRKEIRENLEREVERRLKVRNKDNAMDLLLKVAQLEVPRSLLDMEVQQLMQQAMQDMQERGVKIPQGASLPPDLFADRAQRRVKLGLILAEMIRQHDLSAKPEQVKALVQDYAQSFEYPEEVVKWHYSDPSRLREAEIMALEDNVVALVMSVAKVVDRAMEFDELMGND
jgi:trigger factor